MQGTVATFDETLHHGSLLLDDGRPMAFPAAAFAASGLRLLRVGQRISVKCAADGSVVRVSLVTMP
jgi:2-phospho-L-lactate/phosphoenolpyruvate guanylyltransferase